MLLLILSISHLWNERDEYLTSCCENPPRLDPGKPLTEQMLRKHVRSLLACLAPSPALLHLGCPTSFSTCLGPSRSPVRVFRTPFSGPTHGGGCSFPVLEMHDADCFSVLKSWTYLSCFFNWTLSPLATKFPPQVSCTPHRAWLSLLHRVAQLKYS